MQGKNPLEMLKRLRKGWMLRATETYSYDDDDDDDSWSE